MCKVSKFAPFVLSAVDLESRPDIGTDFIISAATPASLVPSVTRCLVGRTMLDVQVDELQHRPAALPSQLAVTALRWYRKVRPPSLGQRCVWDPSCSRYAELAIRQRGVLRGFIATVRRLWRCRPNEGGTDLP